MLHLYSNFVGFMIIWRKIFSSWTHVISHTLLSFIHSSVQPFPYLFHLFKGALIASTVNCSVTDVYIMFKNLLRY